jgi:hypothetical protein
MANKHILTVFHVVMNVVVVVLFAYAAQNYRDRQPLASFGLVVLSLVLPVAIATRISWTAGFDHGYQAGVAAADPAVSPASNP